MKKIINKSNKKLVFPKFDLAIESGEIKEITDEYVRNLELAFGEFVSEFKTLRAKSREYLAEFKEEITKIHAELSNIERRIIMLENAQETKELPTLQEHKD